jgi:branched-chain amino acid transport system substrate-binding protein
MHSKSKRLALKAALAVAWGLTFASGFVLADEPPVKVGYTQSRSGPFAAGSQTTQEPNYLLWADMINKAGGLNVQGKRRMIELIGVDDRSDIETMVRTYEKFMTVDKVDLILPPWGTGSNFAVAPVANKHGYPMVAPTALSQKLVDMKLPYFFVTLQQPKPMMAALVDMLAANGVKTVAVSYMDDLFGLENIGALEPLLKEKNIRIVDKKSYPLGVKDLSPMLKGMKAANPDAFIGITYPPDNFLITSQSKEIDFAPKIFYTAVGTAFPIYRERMGKASEGVMGMGSWNPKTSPAAKAYFDAHVALNKKEPDRWASAHTWAALQILQQTVEKVGLDRKAMRDFIATHEFDTVLGKMRFNGTEEVGVPGMVGQWQNGEFEIVWPPARATAKPVIPKTWN